MVFTSGATVRWQIEVENSPFNCSGFSGSIVFVVIEHKGNNGAASTRPGCSKFVTLCEGVGCQRMSQEPVSLFG